MESISFDIYSRLTILLSITTISISFYKNTSFRRCFALMMSYLGVDIDDSVSIQIRLCSQLKLSLLTINTIPRSIRICAQHNQELPKFVQFLSIGVLISCWFYNLTVSVDIDVHMVVLCMISSISTLQLFLHFINVDIDVDIVN